jgi:uncharacterized protein (TIGR03435 family)
MSPVAQLRGIVPEATERFEVATVRQNKSGERGPSFFPRPGRFSAENATLQELIMFAYELQAFEIFGGPSWATSDRFDIAATLQPPPTGSDPRDLPPRNRHLLRALLAERFKLVVHEERREMPVYSLVLARPDRTLGERLHPFEGKCMDGAVPEDLRAPWLTTPDPSKGSRPWCILFTGMGRLSARGILLSDLTRSLATFPAVRRRVIDRTGLAGQFDVDMEWTPLTFGPAAPGVPNDRPPETGPNLFTALQEQLGLKLESAQKAVSVLVIDSVNQPSPN